MAKTAISLQHWQQEGRTFSHRRHSVFYRHAPRAGAPVLLLIHGFPTASWDWCYVWEALSAHFTLIAPDMIGYGFSAKPIDYQYSIFDQADLCEGLLAHLGVQRYHLMSHDVGDTVAQELLTRRRERGHRPATTPHATMQSLCLLNGGLFPETHRPRLIQRLLLSPLGGWIAKQTTKQKFGDSMTAIFGVETPPTSEEIDNFWALLTHNEGVQIMPQLIGYMTERKRHRERWVGALVNTSTAEIPIRLINGVDDPVSGRHMAARYAQLVHNADIVLLDHIGHYPHVEAPDAVTRAFLEVHANEVLA